MEKHILINSEILQDLERYATKNPEKEQLAILLGDWSILDGHYIITIQAWVKAKHAEIKNDNVTFADKTWNYVQRIQQIKYPSLKIIGWYRTHPGSNTVLSANDRLIHKYFFNEDWQVAVVTDPLLHRTACFAWHNGKIISGKLRIIGERISSNLENTNSSVKLGQSTTSTPSSNKAIEKDKKLSLLAVALIMLIGFMVGIVVSPLTIQYNPWRNQGEEILVADNLEAVTSDVAPDEPVIDLENEAEQIVVDLDSPEIEVIDDLELTNETQSTEEQPIWIRLIVMSGDTLESLMIRTESLAYKAEIIERNGIINPDQIVIGQELEFPITYR